MASLYRHHLMNRLRMVAISTLSTSYISSDCVLKHERLYHGKVNKFHQRSWSYHPLSVRLHPSSTTFFTQTYTIHSGNALLKKHDLNAIKEEHLELVNVFSPNETLLAEGIPLVYLDKICDCFQCFTYAVFDSNTAPENHRSFRLVKKDDPDISASGEKHMRRVKIVSNHEVKSIEKLQAIVVEDGVAGLTLKPRGSQPSKKMPDLEQYVKNEMRHICSFHFKEGNNIQQTFTLNRAKEDDAYYKRIFSLVYNREKGEVNMLIDYINTVKSFSSDSK